MRTDFVWFNEVIVRGMWHYWLKNGVVIAKEMRKGGTSGSEVTEWSSHSTIIFCGMIKNGTLCISTSGVPSESQDLHPAIHRRLLARLFELWCKESERKYECPRYILVIWNIRWPRRDLPYLSFMIVLALARPRLCDRCLNVVEWCQCGRPLTSVWRFPFHMDSNAIFDLMNTWPVALQTCGDGEGNFEARTFRWPLLINCPKNVQRLLIQTMLYRVFRIRGLNT